MDRLFSAKTKNEKTVKLIAVLLAVLFIDIISGVNAIKLFSASRIVANVNSGSAGKVMGEFMLALICIAVFICATVFCLICVKKLLKCKPGEEKTQNAQDVNAETVLQPTATDANSTVGQDSYSNRRVDASAPVLLSRTMDSLVKTLSERKDEFINFLDLKTLQKEFTEYCASCGLSITSEIATDLISALCSSRLIMLSGEKAVQTKLSKILGGFFGFGTFTQENANSFNSYENMIFNENLNGETNVCLGLYSAFCRKNALNFISLEGVEPTEVDKYLRKIQPYFKAPNVSFSINIDIKNRLNELGGLDKGNIVMPQNVWFILNRQSSGLLPYIYAKYCSEVDLTDATVIDGNAQVIEKQPCYSVHALLSEVDKVNCNGGLSLENWKKIDKIENHLNKIVSFSFDNRSTVQFERYLAVMIELGTDENRAIDKLICYRVLQIVACFSKVKIRTCPEKLDQVIYQALGDGNCSLSVKALSAFELV